MNKQNLLLLPLTAYLLLALPSGAKAENLSLTVNPSKIFISTSSSHAATQRITITNNSSQERIIRIEKKSFTPKKDGTITITNPNISMSKFLSTNIKIFHEGKQIESILSSQSPTKDIEVEIKATKDIINQNIRFGLMITSQNALLPQLQTSSGISALSHIKTGIFIPVIITQPSKNAKVKIRNFTTDNITYSQHPTFSVIISNSSEQDLLTRSELVITDLFGRVVEKTSFTNKILLSNTTSQLASPGSTDYKVSKRLTFGPYKATLKATTKDASYVEVKTIYFLMLEIREIITVLLGITFLLFIINRIKKKRVKE